VVGAVRVEMSHRGAAPGCGRWVCRAARGARCRRVGAPGPHARAAGRKARALRGPVMRVARLRLVLCGWGCRAGGCARLRALCRSSGAGTASSPGWGALARARGPAFGKRAFSAGSREGKLVLARGFALSDEGPLRASRQRMAAPPGRCPSGRLVGAAPLSGSDRSAASQATGRIPLVGRRRHPPAGTCPWPATLPRRG
jgi:hypothetical protein